MAALSDAEIRSLVEAGELKLHPFDEGSLNGAGYDLRADSDMALAPGRHGLMATLETVELGPAVAGIMFIRSSLAREGVLASLAVVDPGFRGQLTISLYNGGHEPFNLKRGERFIQIIFLRLGRGAERWYSGRYQDSSGVVQSRR